MKNVLFTLLFSLVILTGPLSSQRAYKQPMKPYVDFLKTQKITAKDYILSLFKNHDLVILCERDHRDITQYDLYLSVIRDPYFVKNVGNVFTEVGVSTLNPEINRFMHNDSLSQNQVEESLLYFYRKADFWPLWDKYNTYYFLKEFYAINHELSPEDKNNLFPSDVPFDWNHIKTVDDLKIVWKKLIKNKNVKVRDSIMARQIMVTYDSLRAHSRRKKALIIMNYRHAFNDVFDPRAYNTGRFLFRKYHGKIANVLMNNYIVVPTGYVPYSTIQNGKWDAAFELTSKSDIGFDFNNTPFGKDSFDYYPDKQNLTYQDVFTGMAFYKPLREFNLVIGVPGIMNEEFLPELERRQHLLNEMEGKKEQMTPEELIRYYNDKRSFKLPNLNQMEKEINYWIK